MFAVVGSCNGVVKVWEQKTNKTISQWGISQKERQVDQLQFINSEQTEVAVGYQSKEVQFYHLTGEPTSHPSYTFQERLAGLHVTDNGGAMFCCTQDGDISACAIGIDKRESVVHLNKPVTATSYSPNHRQLLVTGGKGQLSELIDLQTGKQAWKARNVANDFLDMQVPMWDKDIDWVDENKRVFVVVTAYHQIRLYDVRSKRRPIVNEDVGNSAFTCVRVNPVSNNTVMAGNTTGDLQTYDLRHKCSVMGRYKGTAGSIRSVSYHTTGKYVAAVGLDRFIHLFETSKRKHVNKTFAKLRFNKVLISTANIQTNTHQKIPSSRNISQEEQQETIEDDDDDDDNILDSLQVIEDVDTKTKTNSTHPKTKSNFSKTNTTTNRRTSGNTSINRNLNTNATTTTTTKTTTTTTHNNSDRATTKRHIDQREDTQKQRKRQRKIYKKEHEY